MFRRLFCKHEWHKPIKIFNPKLPNNLLVGIECSEELFEKLLYGNTKLIFSCKKCNEILEKEYIGEIND